MDVSIVGFCLLAVIVLYFQNNPLKHSSKFIWRRFLNWFPLGMSYSFLYMGRYNLNVCKNALGTLMTNQDFGIIFAAGTFTYGLSFLLNGPIVDKIGGKKGILLATIGAAFMNILMGIVTFLYVAGKLQTNPVITYSLLYAINMFFQSYGAVSIIKVKAYWFHVRERGVFGAIFGTLISFGVYFAFDWGQAIIEASKVHPTTALGPFQNLIRTLFAVDTMNNDATWLVFFIPSIILVFWALMDVIFIKNSPAEAKFEDFDTADASSIEENENMGPEPTMTIAFILKKIFSNPIMYSIAAIDFTSGVLRNGIMQWYPIFANESKTKTPDLYVGMKYFAEHWGLVICMTGIVGGFTAGLVSDKFFQSRRGPPAALNNILMLLLLVIMLFTISADPFAFSVSAVLITLAVIGVHSLMSGTASADFGGKKLAATASGVVDGCVYLGTGLQSLAIGFLSAKDWFYWPMFLIPFAALGIFLSARIWNELPAATRRYLKDVEDRELQKS